MKIKVLGEKWGFCETEPTDFLKELEALLGDEILIVDEIKK